VLDLPEGEQAQAAEPELPPTLELVGALQRHLAWLGSQDTAGLLASPDFQSGLRGLRGLWRGAVPVRHPLLDATGALRSALLFKPFWVRPVSSWKAPEGPPAAVVASFVRHLFVRYPVPDCLLQAWQTEPRPDFKWVCWLILMGQGGSLAEGAAAFGWQLPRRFMHVFAQAPAHLTPVAACQWTLVKLQGGSDVDARRLARHEALDLDPTGPGPLTWGDAPRRSEDDAALWRSLSAWLIKHSAALTDADAEAVLDLALHQHTERRWLEPGPLPLLGWGAGRAREEARLLAERRTSPHARLAWRPRDLDWTCQPEGEGKWTFTELCSGQALAEEGQAMRHCVAGYAFSCHTGAIAIVSVGLEGKRQLTIELGLARLEVRQARGLANRAATTAEQALLGQWLRALEARRAEPVPS
jgi:hypothetical protein